MSEFFNRNFTRREKAMIVVLLVVLLGGLYFLVVHFPIVNRMEEIGNEVEEVEKKTADAEVKLAEYSEMKRELDEILSQPEEDITVMPPYNNIETLMKKLDVIFAGTNPNFSFGQASITDEIAARTINFNCTARDYKEARSLLKAVTGTGYRCLLNSFTLTPVEGGLYEGELKVSGAITFYEHVRPTEEAES